jgi:hypothetical protein
MCWWQYHSDGRHLCQWGLGFFIVDAMGLSIALCYNSRRCTGGCFHRHSHGLCTSWQLHRHYASSCISIDNQSHSYVLEVGKDPMFCCRLELAFSLPWLPSIGIMSHFGKAFGFLLRCYLYHEGKILCHILILAESSNQSLLSMWAPSSSRLSAWWAHQTHYPSSIETCQNHFH